MVANNCISLSGIVKSDLSFGLEICAVHEVHLEFIFWWIFHPKLKHTEKEKIHDIIARAFYFCNFSKQFQFSKIYFQDKENGVAE